MEHVAERVRAKITVEGKVQKVGYRDTVQEIAREHKIVGKVKNLKTGEVQIICEGERQEVENFIKEINIKEDLIQVKNISTTYEKPTGEFKYFEIEYGDVPEEIAEGIGAGRRELIGIKEEVKSVKYEVKSVKEEVKSVKEEVKSVKDEVASVKEEVKAVGNKIDSGFDNLSKKIDSGFDNLGNKMDTNFENLSKKIDTNFQGLDGKYGTISEWLKVINEGIVKLVKCLEVLIEDYIKTKAKNS